jgi:prevent-host-death family protein
MRTVTAMDMRKRLGEILDAASAGERILIERDHRPLAYLVSVEDGQKLNPDEDERRRRRLAALDRLEAFGKEMAIKHPPPDDDLTTVEWTRRERERRTEQIDRAARGLPPLEED